MKRTLGLSCIFLLAVLFIFAGCGEPDDAAEPEEEPAEEEVVDEEADEEVEESEEDVAEEDDDAVHFGTEDYALPGSFAEFIAIFKKIQYTGGEVDGQQTTISYEHIGVEEIDGVETDKIEFSAKGAVEEEGVFDIWVDREGNIQRVIFEGEEIPLAIAQQMAEPLKSAAMAPFYTAQELDLENIFKEPVPGYDQEVVGTETKTFGGQSATVHIVDVSVGPPAEEEDQAYEATVHVADFGDYQVITSWEVTQPYQDTGKGFLKIEEFALR
ncbi:MAG: hypothetical protein R6U91_06990 [Bacillota bacterium]